MPTVAGSARELVDLVNGAARIVGERLEITDEATFRSTTIRDLAWTQTFTEDEGAREAARWIVWEASQQLGARSASIHELYMARGRGEVNGFTVPAINLRAQVFDMARVICQVAGGMDTTAVIFELARSEQTYTFQRHAEFTTNVLAGAIAANYTGPIFMQGDHYQFNAGKYAKDPEAVTAEIRKACVDAVAAGMLNIDIDSSTLVDLSFPTVDEQQRENYTRAAEIAALIRDIEPEGVIISAGGEIGEVGKKNSTVEELGAYLDGFRREFDARCGKDAIGLSKVSVQSGTSHGGVVLPDGSIASVKLDFQVLKDLGELARSHGAAGAVQHGASTLPDEAFHHFPECETAEVHLATGFQNILYESASFPAELTAEIDAWLVANCADERKEGETEEQFLYKTRKKAIGPFKRQMWDLPTKDAILVEQEAKLSFLFDQLKIRGLRSTVERYVKPVESHRPLPESLKVTAEA